MDCTKRLKELYIEFLHLSKVRSSLLDWKLCVKSVDILKVVIFEHADLHGVVLLPPLGILLHFLLVSLTSDPLTPESMNITADHLDS